MRRAALSPTLALALIAFAAPASAQQYWLPNGSGGTTYNNPQGSLLGTMNEHLLQRHMMQRQMQGGSAGSSAGGGAVQGTAGAGAAPRSADPSFRLTNAGKRVVREVYVSAANDSGWGGDRLGSDVLQPGQRIVLRLPMGQCVNDIRVVFMDGQAQERRGVDTCTLTDMSVQ